ncbi:breast cancer anti-estrogen resistance protein 3 homolog isoform X2 [Mauremys mutica]|uniref:breast cancer anti-estrogen resistance protein 3 homolog isoform X2 n=1 Tax=Mauremys mutica TaxID=74926 RepID=UPI001D16A52A|nr:breast cancer anti-estrogen resistance protein 3 homolog isoform X2 [Mauremys mutica]
MDLAKETLRKELEEDLKLSTDELRSHAWYHGCLPREEAESLLGEDGDFLIRDSGSSQGDYVLSCCWRGETLHFKIIRVVLRPRLGYSRTLFQFEQDQFDNVPALVRFYVGNRTPVSETSGAVISRPVNRDVPLRWLQERYGATSRLRLDGQELAKGDAASRRLSLRRLTAGERVTDGNLLRVKDRSGSHPTGLDQLGQRPSLYTTQSDSNLRTGSPEAPAGTQDRSELPPPSPVFRTGSDPVLRPTAPRCLDPEGGAALSGSEGQLHSKAPPKPLRAPSMLVGDASQEQLSTYCELVPKAPTGLQSHVARLHTEEKWRGRARATDTAFGFLEDEVAPLPRPCRYEEEMEGFVRPLLETASSFQPHSFHSFLLPPDNKPLEPGALKRLKDLFYRRDCRTMALHILYIDCLAGRITGVTREQERAMGVSSGLELITLPHGNQLRLDLLERHHLIALGIAVDILGCTGGVAERAATLHKIVQLAVELKGSAGDLFALSAVMKGLQLPQIARLDQTWQKLRQSHTESAIAFEKDLKPLVKRLSQGEGNSSPGEVAIPHLLPLISLMEGEQLWGDHENSCDLLLRTLESARSIATSARAYKATAEAKLQAHTLPYLYSSHG